MYQRPCGGAISIAALTSDALPRSGSVRMTGHDELAPLWRERLALLKPRSGKSPLDYVRVGMLIEAYQLADRDEPSLNAISKTLRISRGAAQRARVQVRQFFARGGIWSAGVSGKAGKVGTKSHAASPYTSDDFLRDYKASRCIDRTN